jgi:hypothetical protein
MMHPQLTEVYGTMKCANPIAARAAVSLIGLGLMVADKKHQEEILEEAARVTEESRAFEAGKMRETIRNLGHPGALHISHELPRYRDIDLSEYEKAMPKGRLFPKESSVQKLAAADAIAQNIGRWMAEQEMEKEARGLGTLLGGLAKGVKGLFKGAPKKFQVPKPSKTLTGWPPQQGVRAGATQAAPGIAPRRVQAGPTVAQAPTPVARSQAAAQTSPLK